MKKRETQTMKSKKKLFASMKPEKQRLTRGLLLRRPEELQFLRNRMRREVYLKSQRIQIQLRSTALTQKKTLRIK